jgi:hypothetical protein
MITMDIMAAIGVIHTIIRVGIIRGIQVGIRLGTITGTIRGIHLGMVVITDIMDTGAAIMEVGMDITTIIILIMQVTIIPMDAEVITHRVEISHGLRQTDVPLHHAVVDIPIRAVHQHVFLAIILQLSVAVRQIEKVQFLHLLPAIQLPTELPVYQVHAVATDMIPATL